MQAQQPFTGGPGHPPTGRHCCDTRQEQAQPYTQYGLIKSTLIRAEAGAGKKLSREKQGCQGVWVVWREGGREEKGRRVEGFFHCQLAGWLVTGASQRKREEKRVISLAFVFGKEGKKGEHGRNATRGYRRRADIPSTDFLLRVRMVVTSGLGLGRMNTERSTGTYEEGDEFFSFYFSSFHLVKTLPCHDCER
ncbi:hypothetical protein IF1G_02741 [Cordyceps javanica]|uniref:Uncharacterized protein n=1 Tax=Cordyceps javanica TaxID=43265 RepID=A0A545VAA2_9HYPO|nr:hypothetical protein IF1G_02741 [Cordyceps javanica]